MQYIDYGLGILSKSAFDALPGLGDAAAFDLADVYERLANAGQLLGFEVFKRFYEIGSLEGLEELEKKLAGCCDLRLR